MGQGAQMSRAQRAGWGTQMELHGEDRAESEGPDSATGAQGARGAGSVSERAKRPPWGFRLRVTPSQRS